MLVFTSVVWSTKVACLWCCVNINDDHIFITQPAVLKPVVYFAVRYNGHFQDGPGSAPGPMPRSNGEHQGPGWTGEDNIKSDLFSEMNLPEIQKLKQQLVTVSFSVFPVEKILTHKTF